ncbi:hypothetical protein MKW92_027642 [Papaver armeniacum]|nr:hypothetical protein MKW92_027642 [Papaver armeniacum]
MRVILQWSTKRIHHNLLYEDVVCDVSESLSESGLISGIKQPKLEMIILNKAYAFFSHTHKVQKAIMPLLDENLSEKDHGKRLPSFGKFLGRDGLNDFLHLFGLVSGYLRLGHSTPFLSLGASCMFPSLAAAKAAVISLGEEIATQELPSGICAVVFVFAGDGTVAQDAQEIFKLLLLTFVDARRLSELFPVADYNSHAECYSLNFHDKIALYACQLQELIKSGWLPVGVADITCDIGGLIEFLNQTTQIEKPLSRYDSLTGSYHGDMEGKGLSSRRHSSNSVSKGASEHFGDILSQFVGNLASTEDLSKLPPPLTSLYEYTPRMQKSDLDDSSESIVNDNLKKKKHNILVPLSGYLFDKFLIKEALDIIEVVVYESVAEKGENLADKPAVVILGAGCVCRRAAEKDHTDEPKDVQVTDAEEAIEGIKNATAIQLDITDHGSLCKYISQVFPPTYFLCQLYQSMMHVAFVINLPPPSCHITIVNACSKLKKSLVTASYVDDSMSKLDEKAGDSGFTILGEMGLDPGIDHMMAIKMINQAHARRGIIIVFYFLQWWTFISIVHEQSIGIYIQVSSNFCCSLGSWIHADNCSQYHQTFGYFSWNPAGATRAGQNPATYKHSGETLHINGFGELLACLAKIGFFNTEPHPALKEGKTLTFDTFLDELLTVNNENIEGTVRDDDEMIDRLIHSGLTKEELVQQKLLKSSGKFLGLHEQTEIPVSCQSAFDVTCQRKEEILAYVVTEQVMTMTCGVPILRANKNIIGPLEIKIVETGTFQTLMDYARKMVLHLDKILGVASAYNYQILFKKLVQAWCLCCSDMYFAVKLPWFYNSNHKS